MRLKKNKKALNPKRCDIKWKKIQYIIPIAVSITKILNASE